MMLTAAMVVVIGFGMGSCVDNADNGTTPSDKEQQEQQAQDIQQAKAEKYWAIVSQLVDIDDYTDDYEDMIFEPVYGVKGSEAGTRYVYTNDMATAAARFADLVERDDIDETTEKYTYDDPDVGKLVYTKGTGRILATVEVSIKQIPSLKKIVYVPGAYANASFSTKAYYRFGDVVSREVDGYGGEKVTEYWICVRPSFGLEGKGDSHWVCLNVLPKKNVWHYHSNTNNNDYYLPTKLGTNQEHMQNLAEMIYAIYYPTEWFYNVENYVPRLGLKMFNDFDPKKVKYHNQYFWMNVQEGWKNAEVLKYALNYEPRSDRNFQRWIAQDNIRLLYKGYSWWTTSSWTCKLYAVQYRDAHNDNDDPDYKRLNNHSVRFSEPTMDMQHIAVDFRKTGAINIGRYIDFFEGSYNTYWTVRHATGKELASGGTYEVDRPIPGVKDFYRYYRDVVKTEILTEEPEVTPKRDEPDLENYDAPDNGNNDDDF